MVMNHFNNLPRSNLSKPKRVQGSLGLGRAAWASGVGLKRLELAIPVSLRDKLRVL